MAMPKKYKAKYPCDECTRKNKDSCRCPSWKYWFSVEWNEACEPFRALKSKSNGTFVCSYTCMLESERIKPQRKNKTKGVMI